MYDQWHLLTSEVVLEKLGTGKNGLSSDEAKERFAKYGPNLLKEAPKNRHSFYF